MFNFQSPYAYAANNPIKFIDKNGENPLLGLALLWEASGYLAGALTATLVANKVYQNNREGWNHQRNQDRRAKRDVDSRQAKVRQSSKTNMEGRTPEGDNFPKRPPGEKTVAKIVTGVAVGTVVASEMEALSELEIFDQGNGSDTQNLSGNGDSEYSEMNSVCGEHLSQTDTEYWDSLTDDQRQGYNQERNRQWQEHQTNSQEEEENP